MDIRVGKIIEVWTHQASDQLYLEKIDVGNGDIRTVASGLQKHIPIEDMKDRLVVVLTNLKPRAMKAVGIESQGMVLCGQTDSKVELVDPPAGSVAGDLISFEGQARSPPAEALNSKKFFDKVAPDMAVNSKGEACWKEVQFKTDKGVCTVKSLKEGKVC